MKTSTFSVIWAVLYAGFGLGLLFVPAQFMAPYGVTLDSYGVLMSRVLGSALTAYALAFILNRNIPLTEAGWRNLLLASVVYNLVDIPVVLMATVNGVMNSLGWLPTGLHIFLAASMGYFLFRK